MVSSPPPGPFVVTLPPATRPPAPARPATTPPRVTPTPTPTVAARPAITVLNNSRVTGLAKKAAADFAAGGWPIAGTGNLGGRLPRTTVYYPPGGRDAALALRRQFPAIADMAPRYPGLPGAPGLTVVVTRDYPH